MKRISSLLFAVMLMVAAAPLASGHTDDPQHYSGQCMDGPALSNPAAEGRMWARHSASGTFAGGYYTGVGRVTGVGMHITARALEPCIGGDATHLSKTAQLASIEGRGTNGVYNFVQVGIYKKNNAFANGCGGEKEFVNDQTSFAYTPDATKPGVLCRANWFDTDNNGHGNDPIGGHIYSFSINQWNSGSVDKWNICITDTNTGVGDCTQIPRTTPDSGIADPSPNAAIWWACEVGNLANALGVRDTNPAALIAKTRYEKASNPGVWYYTENSTVFGGWGATPYYYGEIQSQAGLGESVDCFTTPHS